MAVDRRWVQRLIDEERAPAIWILIAAGVALAFANVVDYETLHAVLEFGPSAMPLHLFASDGLLVVFFYIAGLELRHELTIGSLNSARAAAVPVLAAVAGMAIPATLFSLLDPAHAQTSWGLPIATDLPLALALLAVAGRSLPTGFRAFILTLAIVDDALSIIIIAVTFGGAISPLWLLATCSLVVLFALLQRRSGSAAFVVAVAAWLAMLQTGVHPTVLGVALGLATTRNPDAVRNRWQPVSAYVAVPLFVASALALPVDHTAIDGRLMLALSVARVVGKPLGICLGAMLAVRLFSPDQRLSALMYARAGAVASIGFSVSLLFADLALPTGGRPTAVVSILMAMAASAAAGTLALRGTPARR